MQNYISIQQIRFGDQFKYELEVPEHLTHIAVVKFILQPIVENCLKHGLSGFEEGGIIRIKVVEKDKLLSIEVSDNGIGMDKDKVIQVNAEILRSLENQNQRVRKPWRHRIEQCIPSPSFILQRTSGHEGRQQSNERNNGNHFFSSLSGITAKYHRIRNFDRLRAITTGDIL